MPSEVTTAFKHLGYGFAGLVILPCAAIIALPQRLYHSCRRKKPKEIQSIISGSTSFNLVEQHLLTELNAPYLYKDESREERFLMQSTTRLPAEIVAYQNVCLFLLFCSSELVVGLAGLNYMVDAYKYSYLEQWNKYKISYIKNCLKPADCKFSMNGFFKFNLNGFMAHYSKFYLMGLFIMPVGTITMSTFIMSTLNPRLVLTSIEYIKDTFKGILHLNTVNAVDRENRSYVYTHNRFNRLYVSDHVRDEISSLDFNYDRAQNYVLFCPKQNLKEECSELNTRAKEIIFRKNRKNSLDKIFPSQLIVKLIEDYVEDYTRNNSVICFLYKNSMTYPSGTAISVPRALRPILKDEIQSHKISKRCRV